MALHATESQTEHGLLVEVPFVRSDLAELWASLRPEEHAVGPRFADRRKLTFAAGRFALRRALTAAGVQMADPIVPNHRGAPTLPEHVRGSISHKDALACALVTLDEPGFIGVDVEDHRALEDGVMRMLLTEQERANLPDDAASRCQLVLQTFSLKEALYKAIDPYFGRYIDFLEVEVWPTPDGTARVDLKDVDRSCPLDIDARWFDSGPHVISTVRARRR